MIVVQNEFILLINAYYQADALSKDMISSGIFGNIQIQPELSQFREHSSQSLEKALNFARAHNYTIKEGEIDKEVIKAKLKEIYKIGDIFIYEIENSISKAKIDNGDMSSYRISFQMASDTIYNFVGGTIQNFANHMPLKEGIHSIINSILNENFWSGEEIKRQIEFVRSLNTHLHYSDNWIKEYAYKMFI